ncbi:hypothetical protein CCY01nite_26160 [Chitinophaga cymbidii]|uniref:Uncharacterized protein n=1 Tax=Chitinophaga cymbidii TaxID=1096750 RepID=A0A512RKX8_9BACT|nr:hypothetical protein CCY01nite_26160 [Chitinophaga cymbidii]
MINAFYGTHGCYGLPDFKMLANKMGLMEKRAERIIRQVCTYQEAAETMVRGSALNEVTKQAYIDAYLEKLRRIH